MNEHPSPLLNPLLLSGHVGAIERKIWMLDRSQQFHVGVYKDYASLPAWSTLIQINMWWWPRA